MNQITNHFLNLPQPPYFHRESSYDSPIQEEDEDLVFLAKGATRFLTPFIGLYQPSAPYLTITCEYMRFCKPAYKIIVEGNTSIDNFTSPVVQIAISIAIFAATALVSYPLGMVILTGRELLLDATYLRDDLQHRDYNNAKHKYIRIVNNSLYLAALVAGGLPLTLASFTAQMAVCAYYAKQYFSIGNHLLCAHYLLLGLARGCQAHSYYQLITNYLLKLPEPVYFHRSYVNDIPTMNVGNTNPEHNDSSWVLTSKWTFYYLVPLLSAYSPQMNRPLGTVCGTLRVFTYLNELKQDYQAAMASGDSPPLSSSLCLKTAVATAALGGMLFHPSLGMVITTIQDLFIRAMDLKKLLDEANYESAKDYCIALFNHSLYLAILLGGGPGITMTFFAVQTLVEAYAARWCFANRDYPAGATCLVMALIRSYQGYHYYQLHRKINFLPENRLPHTTPIEVQNGSSLRDRVALVA